VHIREAAFCGIVHETPASGHIRVPRLSKTGLIAMQKVVGSNPTSRFEVNPLHLGHSALGGESNHPLISPPFWGTTSKMRRS
jgi:hypothetical protein